MSDRDFLTFKNNTQYVLQTLYDEPKSHSGNYGEQHIFAVLEVVTGVEYAVSQKVGSTLDSALMALTKGEMITVEKRKDENNHWPFHIERGNQYKEATTPTDQLKPVSNGNPTQNQGGNPHAQPKPVDWDLKDEMKNHEIRKAICIKLAVDKIPEGAWDKKIETEIMGKYTTLMLIMSDDLEIVLHKIQTATSVFHLNAMWKKYSKLWGRVLSSEDFGHAIDECSRIKETFTDKKEDPKPDKQPIEEILEGKQPEPAGPDEGDGYNFDKDDEPLPF